MVAESDIVSSHFTVSGTHEGSFPDLDPTGKEFEIDGMEFDRVEDGKLVETWLMPDVFGFLQQLGVLSEKTFPVNDTVHDRTTHSFSTSYHDHHTSLSDNN